MAERRRELTDDEQSNLELEVLGRNHSVLYRAISADDIVPSLFAVKLITSAQMEDISSRTTGGARNTALLTALRGNISPLHRFCRILSNTPGQEYLAERLLQDYEKMKSQLYLRYTRKRSSASDSTSIPGPVKVARSTKRLTPSSKSFGLFLRDLITILEGDHKAIASMKVVLKSMTLPLQDEDGEDDLSVVINSPKYNEATTIVELVDALSPCWNEFDCDLLDTLVKASCSEAAIKKMGEFLEERDPDMPLVVRTTKHHTAADSDAAVGELTTPSQATLRPDELSGMDKQSTESDVTHPYILLPLVPDSSTDQSLAPVGAVIVMVRTSNEQITIAEMHSIKEATCHNLRLPKEAMLYIQSLTGSVTLIFYASIKLIRYLHAQVLWLEELYSLRSHGVHEIIIPDQYHLIVPSLEDLEYLQASQFGYGERVLSMIEKGVPVDVTDPYGQTALQFAAYHGHHRVVELLVRAGASLDHQSKDGFSALMCASQEGHEQVVDVLLRSGASPQLQTEYISEEGECQFVTVVCPYDCGDGFQRRQLEGHKANDCPKRPFPCQYCGYEATYIEVTSEHWPICDEYPLPCPNQCENDIKRQDLQDHLQKTCPREVIKCEFSYAGCEVECQRQHMQTHLDENVRVHLTKLSHKTEQQQSQIDTLERKTEQQQSQIDALERKTEQQQLSIWRHNSQMHSMVSTLNRVVGPTFSPTPEIEMDNFEHCKTTETRWFSNSFYSHLGGYKMCLAIDANGRGCGKGTHISIFVHLKHGQHDKHLKWPFRGAITIQLLNWKDDDIDDKGHWQKIVFFEGDLADPDIGCKVSWWKGKVGTNSTGMGYNQFIAHTELNAADKNYLHNDCLRFKILEVVGANIDVL